MVMLRLPVLAAVATAAVCLRGCEAAPLAGAEAPASSSLARRGYYDSMVRIAAEGAEWARAAFSRVTAPVTGAGKYSALVSDDVAGAAGSAAKLGDDVAGAAGNAAKLGDDVADDFASHLDNAEAARFQEKVFNAQANVFNAQFPRSVEDAEEAAQLARKALADAIEAGDRPASIDELTAFVQEADDAVLLAKNPRPMKDLQAELAKAKDDLAIFLKLDKERASLKAGARTLFDARVDQLNRAEQALLRGQKEAKEALAKGAEPPNLEALRATVKLEEDRMERFLPLDKERVQKLALAEANMKAFLDSV